MKKKESKSYVLSTFLCTFAASKSIYSDMMFRNKELDVKREFVNNIAQELRSPLNPITGFSDILADSSIELQPEEREMMSTHIKENSKVLTNLIDNMIELSLYESKNSLPNKRVIKKRNGRS